MGRLKRLAIITLVVFALSFLSFILLDITDTYLLYGTKSNEIWVESDAIQLEDIYTFDIGDDDFRILLLTDIQIGSRSDYSVFDEIDTLVKDTNPHLIITLGDNTQGLNSHTHTNNLITHMEQYNIPWVVTLGNHDDEGFADRTWIGNAYQDADNSLFQMGPNTINGIGNFVLNIESYTIPVYSLIMMDSNGLTDYEHGRDYDVIHENQIQWYEWVMKELPKAYGIPVNSMLFFHIPIPEFNNAQEEFLKYSGTNPDIFGTTNEAVFSPPVNSGLFETILEYESTTHLFVGHDHINSFSYPYQGVQFTYVLKTGINSYNDETLNGGTLLTISSKDVTLKHIYIDHP